MCIKIDVEGMEHRAIKGARELISKNRPIIYAEANYANDFVKIQRVLESLEYAHWDTFGFSPTHLFLPLEQVSEKQLLANNGSKLALLGLFHTNYKQPIWLHNALEIGVVKTMEQQNLLDSTCKLIQQKFPF